MSFLDPKPISATAIAAQVANPASVIGSQLSATIDTKVSDAVAPLASTADLDAVAALIGAGGNVIASSDPNKVLTPGQVQQTATYTGPKGRTATNSHTVTRSGAAARSKKKSTTKP